MSMMEVSNSSNNMEGIEGPQGNGNNAKRVQDTYDSNPNRIAPATGPMRYFALVEESIEPSPMECAGYEQYVHLPELSAMWKFKEWPGWSREGLVKPALQSLEITFRFISSVLCDTRTYIDKEEWKRRLESLTGSQIELISMICEDDKQVPTVHLSVSSGVLATKVAQEVWQRPGALPVVSRTSEESLLPRLGTWKRAEDMVSRIWLAIEGHMQRTPFTLGLGEPNLSGKPILEYDRICKPNYLHSLKQQKQFLNPEDSTLWNVLQIFEAWVFVAHELLHRIYQRIESGDFVGASTDCWMVERIWKMLTEIVDLLLVMDPDDFLRLKHQLAISSTTTPAGAYCLRSAPLRELTNACKELRHLVPKVMGVEADPKGGPRLQEALMHLFHSHGLPSHSTSGAYHASTIHVLLAFQAIEAAVKRFFFSYQQLVVAVMGSIEMKGPSYLGGCDALSQIYFEPPYFPSVDGAKTFLGDYWH